MLPAARSHFTVPSREHAAPDFSAAVPPDEAGVYVWCSGDERAVLYIGSAARLSRRLGDETRWIAEHDPASGWAPSVIHFLQQHHAIAYWVPTDDHADARLLERRLIEWHRTTVGCAPLLTGWAPKPSSEQGEALAWARKVWNTDPALHRSLDPTSHLGRDEGASA